MLSIVPYWNWNKSRKKLCPYWAISQSYHTGIEIVMTNSFLTNFSPLNRTILELKLVSNHLVLILNNLSIVPYWNWNNIKFNMSESLDDSQSYHTGIEIEEDKLKDRIKETLNRTILELKYLHTYAIFRDFLHSQSYHTGIEIQVATRKASESILSIVPYWNWNIGEETAKATAVISQSYHTGIEIYKEILLQIPSKTLNRTILELK